MSTPARGRIWYRVGLVLSVLAIAFLAFDAGAKLAQLAPVMEATAQLGFPPASARWLGAVLLICVLLYAWPATAVFGALLLTAYLGGAVAAHLRIGSPLFSHLLFPVYVAAVVWAGLALRRPPLMRLLRGQAETPTS